MPRWRPVADRLGHGWVQPEVGNGQGMGPGRHGTWVGCKQARGNLSVCSGTIERDADRLSGTRGEQMQGSEPAPAAREGGRATRTQSSRVYIVVGTGKENERDTNTPWKGNDGPRDPRGS
jgi:hypothetical protein